MSNIRLEFLKFFVKTKSFFEISHSYKFRSKGRTYCRQSPNRPEKTEGSKRISIPTSF